MFRSAIEKAGLEFTIECASPSEPIYVDRDMWEKIVLNLLSNAFKFTHQGKVSLGPEPDNKDQLPEEANKDDVEQQELQQALAGDQPDAEQIEKDILVIGDA